MPPAPRFFPPRFRRSGLVARRSGERKSVEAQIRSPPTYSLRPPAWRISSPGAPLGRPYLVSRVERPALRRPLGGLPLDPGPVHARYRIRAKPAPSEVEGRYAAPDCPCGPQPPASGLLCLVSRRSWRGLDPRGLRPPILCDTQLPSPDPGGHESLRTSHAAILYHRPNPMPTTQTRYLRFAGTGILRPLVLVWASTR